MPLKTAVALGNTSPPLFEPTSQGPTVLKRAGREADEHLRTGGS